VGGEVGMACLGAAVLEAFIAILAYTVRLNLSRDKVSISPGTLRFRPRMSLMDGDRDFAPWFLLGVAHACGSRRRRPR
jgi:MYXO-CTERM domain-containing protein